MRFTAYKAFLIVWVDIYGWHSWVKPGNEGGHLHLYINLTSTLPAKPGPTNQEFTRYNSLKGVHKVQLLKQFGRKVALNLLCDRCIVSSRMQSSVFARFGFSCRLIVVTPETDFCGCIM